MYERSSLFGPEIIHGFGNRRFGLSWDTFAFWRAALAREGRANGAPGAAMKRLATQGGFAAENLRLAHQVHGTRCVRAVEIGPETEADAVIHHRDEGDLVVGVLTADCVPLLLADEREGVVAAVHCGRRGAVSGMVEAAVQAMLKAGARQWRIVAALGPCIDWRAYEVDRDIADEFGARFIHTEGYGKPRVDLAGEVKQRLRGVGVAPNHVERIGGSTFAEPERYFSFRRDGESAGWHLSFIGFRSKRSSAAS